MREREIRERETEHEIRSKEAGCGDTYVFHRTESATGFAVA